MRNIHLVTLICSVFITVSVIFNYISNVKPSWDALIKQQKTINSESKRYGEKLRSLEQTVMSEWESAYQSVGNSDRVSLSKQLNIHNTALKPFHDVPSITANESIVNTIGGMQVNLGLRKVCFGQGVSGYVATGQSINSVVSAMRTLEKNTGTDFDQFTITSSKNGLKVNFYDLCVYLKDGVNS
tara:strand:+ start:945 stop:1496 length:552 start_codon:yes stop_codon:yes gene_type:complete